MLKLIGEKGGSAVSFIALSRKYFFNSEIRGKKKGGEKFPRTSRFYFIRHSKTVEKIFRKY